MKIRKLVRAIPYSSRPKHKVSYLSDSSLAGVDRVMVADSRNCDKRGYDQGYNARDFDDSQVDKMSTSTSKYIYRTIIYLNWR